MYFPITRGRRLRRTANLRRMVRETSMSVDNLIYPMFSIVGRDVKEPISSMPGIFQQSVGNIVAEAREVHSLGIPAVILFGIPDHKDPSGSGATQDDGIIQNTIRALKDAVPELTVITDVCLCEYTSHGHCGILDGEEVDNDATLSVLVEEALSHVEAGADMVAPSDMMDGRVGAIREALDEEGHPQVPVMSYAVKYASAFYGPFREAAESTPSFGDRRGYQMDPANIREAIREAAMDVEEGADILMVKPGLPYLDVISALRDQFDHPIAAYQVSGEYSMIKAASANGWLEEDRVVMESLIALRRGGADLILSYFAKDAARLLNA
jgi:porphobilinogen synthase